MVKKKLGLVSLSAFVLSVYFSSRTTHSFLRISSFSCFFLFLKFFLEEISEL